MKSKNSIFGDPSIAPDCLIFAQSGQSAQEIEQFPSLTDTAESLQALQEFQPEVRAAAMALLASNLAVQCRWTQETAELQLFWISLRAGLGGEF